MTLAENLADLFFQFPVLFVSLTIRDAVSTDNTRWHKLRIFGTGVIRMEAVKCSPPRPDFPADVHWVKKLEPLYRSEYLQLKDLTRL